MDFHGYSPLFMDFHQLSWNSTDYQGFPPIILDFQPSEPSVQWKELMFPCQKEAKDSVDFGFVLVFMLFQANLPATFWDPKFLNRVNLGFIVVLGGYMGY